MLTPLDVYLVMQADTFKSTSAFTGFLWFIAAPMLFIVWAFLIERGKKYVIITSCCSFLLSIFFFTLSIFIPSSQTLGAMYLVPQVVNSKQAQKLDALSLKVLDLVEHVTDKADEALKEGKE